MTPKLEAHARTMTIYEDMSHADMSIFCKRLQALYPNIIYFAPDSYHARWPRQDYPGKFDSGPREPQLPEALFADSESCFQLLRDEQLQYDRAPGVHMALRAPWPEEDASGDAMRRRAWPFSATTYTVYDDPTFWRKKGRLLDVLFPPSEPQTEDGFENLENRWVRDPKFGGFTQAHFGGARLLHTSMTGGVKARYNISDPECAAFFRDVRSIFGKQKTIRMGHYAPSTHEYLGPITGRYKSSCGRDMLRWLCHHPDVFTSFTVLDRKVVGKEMRLAGKGPAPDFKAEVFLEEGLPIDDVAGLTEADRDRLKRRFERKQKLVAKAPTSKN